MFNDAIVEELLMTVKLLESAIENELLRRVKAIGGACEKVTVLGQRGFFDRLIVLPGGRVVFCELKRPDGGRLSAHQILRIDQYRRLGAEVAVVRNSADIDRLLLSSR
jgi:hypothetical protein